MGRTSVFELSFHINRLAESCRLMLQAEADVSLRMCALALPVTCCLHCTSTLSPGGPAARVQAAPSLLQKTAGVDSSQLLKQHQFITEAARLRLDVIASLHTAVDAFLEAHPRHQGELKLTVLVTWQGRQEVHTHVAALPPRPQPPVKAQVHPGCLVSLRVQCSSCGSLVRPQMPAAARASRQLTTAPEAACS